MNNSANSDADRPDANRSDANRPEDTRSDSMEKVREFLFENKVVLLFLAITLLAYHISGMSYAVFFSDLFTRFGRNTFLVLSLLIPVVAGLGLNFGIVLGAMAAQIAIFLVVLWGGSGLWGLLAIATLATPIAILFGFLVGRLFNSMKGAEMIGGMVTGFFADGFYQFFFLFVMGGIIPIANERVMTGTGVGVLNAINLGDSPVYMRQALDNVPMLHILDVALWGYLAFFIGIVIFRLAKKQPVNLLKRKKQNGLLRNLLIFASLVLVYGLSFVIDPLFVFLSQNRLSGLIAVDLVLVLMGAVVVYRFVKEKFIIKKPGIPKKPIIQLVLVIGLLLLTWHPEIYGGLTQVRIPVLTYLIIVGTCFMINWFLKTRLGQNMRTIGHNRAVATAAGINVDRTRIIAMILSTLLAAYGQIISLQNFGIMNTYGAHGQVGMYAIAALLVGGATVSRASVKNALMGVLLFHALFILAPMAGTQLMGDSLIGEYFRVVVANAVIALALIMHAWQRVKTKKTEEEPQEPDSPATGPKLQDATV